LARRETIGPDPQQQMWIGIETPPDRALAGVSNAGEIRAAIQQVHNDLEMDVRRPVAIFLRRADAANALAARELLADAEPNERVPRQVAIQGEKLCAIAGRVPKDNERA